MTKSNRQKCAVFALLTLSVIPALADSIDESEAKRRGVPVAQVEAERALEGQRQLNKKLEEQVADLERQLAEARAAKAGGSAVAPADAAFDDAPREPFPVYDDLVKRYLSGDWATLASDLNDKKEEIAKLPQANRSDLDYINKTVAECRPGWWDMIKRSGTTQFGQVIWDKNKFAIYFQQSDAPVIKGNGLVRNIMSTHVGWNAAENGLPRPHAHGIRQGRDGCCFQFHHGGWRRQLHLEDYRRRPVFPGQRYPRHPLSRRPARSIQPRPGTMGIASPAPIMVFPFRPPLVCLIQGATALDEGGIPEPIFQSHRVLGSAFLIELRSHLDRYPTLKAAEVNFTLDPKRQNAEFYLADFLINRNLLNANLTLAEDRHLRDLVQQLAKSNPDWKNPKIKLAGNLTIDLNPDSDKASRPGTPGISQS